MEVHHHTHHPKKWKEYFWEFLMLFLAVFCGFMAEYQLEHMIEKEREVQYIKGLVQDLVSDTANINRAFELNVRKDSAWNALLQLRDKDLNQPDASTQFYARFLKGTFLPVFRPSITTMVQLKNSGNFRLIHRKGITDSILKYDLHTQRILTHSESLVQRNDEVWNAVYPIMAAGVLFDKDKVNYNERKLIGPMPPLRTDKVQLQVFFGTLGRMLLTNKVNRDLLLEHKEKAKTLLDHLKGKYNLN